MENFSILDDSKKIEVRVVFDYFDPAEHDAAARFERTLTGAEIRAFCRRKSTKETRQRCTNAIFEFSVPKLVKKRCFFSILSDLKFRSKSSN